MSGLILVRVNCPDLSTAEAIAGAAVKAGLAPCANIVPAVRSIYRWRGAIEREEEAVLWLKAAEPAWPKLEAFISERHPAETPAILALPCIHVHDRYADWLAEETTL